MQKSLNIYLKYLYILMKIEQKSIYWKSGYIRFPKFGINWHLYNWALPFAFDIHRHNFAIEILFITIYLR